LLVLIDESGDAGFKTHRASSPVFSLVMVIFRETKEAERASAAIKALQDEHCIFPEFKFSGTQNRVKDAFFQAVTPFDFTVRAVVVQKDRIRSPHLKTHTERFYSFFMRNMMSHDGGILKGARVKIDGSGSRKFKKEMVSYLRRHTADGALGRVTFERSHSDHLIQLADMVSGAVHRSYHPDKANHDRWRQMLESKVENVWEFQ